MLLSLVLLPAALAAVEVDSNDLTMAVDYADLRDNDDTIEISQSVTLTNSGNATENVTLSLTSLQTGYSLTISPTTLSLAPGNLEVTIEGDIPVDQQSGLNEIGNLKVVTASGQDQSFALKTDLAPILELDRIYVYVNGNEEEKINSDDDNINNLRPGDEVELRFLIKNSFDEEYNDGNIEGTITLELDDSKFGDDIDEDLDFDVDAGDETVLEEVSFAFIVPSDADEGTYSLDILMEADSDSDASQELSWTVNLEVERENDDVRIDSLTVSPAEVSCNRRIAIDANVVNYGSDSQSHVVLNLKSDSLNINQRYEFTLEKGGRNDDSVSKQFVMEVPADAILTTHLITATLYYDYTITADRQMVELDVKECKTTTPFQNTTTATTTNTTPPPPATTTPSAPITGAVVQTVESSSYEIDDFLIAAMIVGIVLLVALVILITLLIAKK